MKVGKSRSRSEIVVDEEAAEVEAGEKKCWVINRATINLSNGGRSVIAKNGSSMKPIARTCL